MRNFLIPICLILASQIVWAQKSDPTYIPPTPNASKLMQAEISPPNLYTGAASTSVPIHSFDFDGEQISLSMNYSSGGTRVSEEASYIGLGWSMNPIGHVSRTVMGFNDFANSSYLKGYVYDPDSIPTTVLYDDDYYKKLEDDPIDTEPDKFTYALMGSSGEFILEKKSGGVINVIKLTQNADKIEFIEGTKTFTVTTPSGFKGTFSQKEYTTSVSGSSSTGWDGCSTSNINLPDAQNHDKRAITSWYLTTLLSPRNKSLSFSYKVTSGLSNYVSLSQDVYSERGAFHSTYSVPDYKQQGCSKTIYEHVYLDEITSSDLSFEITFDYATRTDLDVISSNFITVLQRSAFVALTPLRLTGINIDGTTNSNMVKDVTLTHSYFDGGAGFTSSEYQRLKLDKVQIDDQVYEFDYYMERDFPEKSSLSIDYWGYYNGEPNSILYPAVGTSYPNVNWPPGTDNADLGFFVDPYFYYQSQGRKANFSFGQIGLLQTITYPTGGTTEYTYEAHDYRLEGNEVSVPTGNVFTSVSGLDGAQTDDFYYSGYKFRLINGLTCGICHDDCPLRAEVTFGVYCKNYWQTPTPPCDITSADATKKAVELLDENNNVVVSYSYDQLWGPSLNQFSVVLDLELDPGTYTLKAYRETNTSGETRIYGTASASITGSCSIPTFTSQSVNIDQVAGGARVSQIVMKDSDGSSVLKRTYDYDQSSSRTSGRLMSPLLNVYKHIGLIPDEMDPNGFYDDNTSFTYYMTTSGSMLPGTTAAQGSHVGYSQVREYYESPGSGSGSGYKQHTFFNLPNSLSTMGLSLNNIVNKSNGRTDATSTHQEGGSQVHFYDPSYSGTNVSVARGMKIQEFYGQPSIREAYNIYKRAEVMHQVKEITEMDDGTSTEVITNYTYNTNGLMLTESMTNSDAKTQLTEYKYADQYSSSTGINKMVDRNMVGIPVETITKVDNAVVAATGTQYGVVGDMAVPSKVYEFNRDIGSFSGSTNGSTFAGGYEERVSFDQYDAYGNPVEYTSSNGVTTAIIWGYDYELPVAIIENATISQVQALSYSAGSGFLSNSEATTLRNGLPNARVTVYQYDPPIGVTRIIDPNGYSTYYTYDSEDRLYQVKDKDSNVLKQYEYQYSNN